MKPLGIVHIDVDPGVLAAIAKMLAKLSRDVIVTPVSESKPTLARILRGRPDLIWVRLFHDALDGSGFDHLTSVSFGRRAPSGLGTAPLA
jgi:hypothetical protein